MKRTTALVIMLITLFMISNAAASTGNYDLSWYVVAGGGANSRSGSFSLDGAIGQPIASTSSGGGYILTGGFFAQNIPLLSQIYLPFIRR